MYVDIYKYYTTCMNFYGQCDDFENPIYSYKFDLTKLKLIKR